MKRWNGPGGYSHLLSVGMPLVMSMISHSVMQFTDRIFLANYSIDAIAASLPGSITSFLFIAFFMGVAEYVSVFVAQYTGAVRHERVGAAIWQGLWFCIPASLFLASLALVAEPIFILGGHAPQLIPLEVDYFRILTMGGGLIIISTTLSCFYSGRGITLPVMLVNMIGAAVNIPLDYALINGWWIFPEMGIRGAGLATVCGNAVMVLLFLALIFKSKNDQCYGVLRNWKFDWCLMKRFLSYGLPGGVNFFMDIFAITFFVFMIGRVGPLELAATNIVISLDLLAFLPVIGMGIATGIVVGQGIGAGDVRLGHRGTGSAMHISVLYMGLMGLLFIGAPELLMSLFHDQNMSDADFQNVSHMGTVMLRYVAAYALLDGVALTYLGALKGAGDIKWVMWTLVVCSLTCMVLPITLFVNYTELGFHGPWICLFFYVLVLTIASWKRFHSGKWKDMSVIDLKDDSDPCKVAAE